MARQTTRKLIAVGLAAAVCLAACSRASDLPGQGVTVRMARATWETGWFQARVIELLLEELGYAVAEPETLNAVAFYFFAAGGDVDFWANGWFPLHQRYLEYPETAEKVRPVGVLVGDGALQGYLVDVASLERFGITHLGDLARPEVAEAFDSDGDGRADLVGCDAGWGCAGVIDHHLTVYGLHETVTHVQGEYSALMTAAISRFERGEALLAYTWTPNWTVSELKLDEDVAWLPVPYSSLPHDETAATAVADVAGCPVSPCDLGFGVNDIRIVANTEFLDRNPAAAALLELVEIRLDTIATQNKAMRSGEDSEEDIRRHAQQWIESNRELVDGWLAVARQAAE